MWKNPNGGGTESTCRVDAHPAHVRDPAGRIHQLGEFETGSQTLSDEEHLARVVRDPDGVRRAVPRQRVGVDEVAWQEMRVDIDDHAVTVNEARKPMCARVTGW